MLKKLFFLIVLFTFFCLQSQQKESVDKYKDSVIKLIDKSFYLNGNESLELLDKSITITKKYNLDSLFIVANSNLFYLKNTSNDSLNKQRSLKALLKMYKEKNNLFAYAKYNDVKAFWYETHNKIDSAYFCYNKSLKAFLDLKYHTYIGQIYNYLTYAQFKAGDRVGFELNVVKALKHFEKHKDYYEMSLLSMYQGLSYGSFNLKESQKCFDKALEYIDSIKKRDFREEAFLLVKLNNSYVYSSKDFKKMYKISKEGLDYYKKSKYKKFFFPIYVSILENYAVSEINTVSRQKGFKRLLEAYKLAEENNLEEIKIFALYDLAYFFKEEKENLKAIKFSEKSLKLAKKHNDLEFRLNSIKLLASLYSGKKSKEFYEKYIRIKDSLTLSQLKTREQFALYRFEAEKKEIENVTLKQENLLNKVKLKNERQRSNLIALAAILSLLFASFIYYIYSTRKKEFAHKTNLEKAKARDQERIEIASKLHDEVVGNLRIIHKKALQLKAEEIHVPLCKIKKDIRNISHKLSSINFEEVSFKDQTINLITDYFSPKFKIKISNLDSIDWSLINNQIKRALFLVMREFIQNSKKHSKATKIEGSFNYTPNKIELFIIDNGKGFDINSSKKRGIGIKNQRRRVEELDGVFTIKSTINFGTSVTVEIPLKA